MASKSETGHAKNVAGLDLLNTHIIALGDLYQPTNDEIYLATLQEIYSSSFAQNKMVNTTLAPYSFAVDEREAEYEPLNRDLSKLRKTYKSTKGVTGAQLEDFMTAVRKIKGTRKVTGKPSTDPAEEQNSHSVSQMSYDNRANNLDLVISILENTPNYNPNEEAYKVSTYIDKKARMLQKTKAVAQTFIPLNNARSTRNHTLYHAPNNLVDAANKAKDYIFTILDHNSPQYKAIAKIKFRKD